MRIRSQSINRRCGDKYVKGVPGKWEESIYRRHPATRLYLLVPSKSEKDRGDRKCEEMLAHTFVEIAYDILDERAQLVGID